MHYFLLSVVLFLSGLTSVTPAYAASEIVTPDTPQAPLNERVFSIPGDDSNLAMLQVTVLTPDGPGPFPLAVLNHGASGSTMRPADEPRSRTGFLVDYFLSRGYAVVLPMMRGFAGSGGALNLSGCDYASVGLDDAKDIRAVINYMVQQPYVDGTRIIVGGQSFGGWNTLALGTLHIPNVKGLVNFVGGMITARCARPEASLIAAAGRFGARAQVPSIWFYGDNDKLFSPPTWRAMYRSYTAAGGHAELVAFGTFMNDSHEMLSFNEGFPIWMPKVDAFLNSISMPSRLVYPQYKPMDVPPPTHYAALDDVDAVPYISDQGRAVYRRFLARPLPRAVAIAPNSMIASYTGADALRFALEDCSRQAKQCQLYAVDNDVVWVKPTVVFSPTKIDLPPPSHYAALDDIDAVPYLNDQGRELYRRFLTKPLPRAIAIAPSGMASSYTGGFDPLAQALKSCSQQATKCQLYAVNNDVVWVRPTPAPPPTSFAALTDQNAVPYLNARGRDGYEKFLTLPKPRAFVVAPDGAWNAAALGPDPIAYALNQCNKLHQGCRLYAVDNKVVWPEQ